MKAIRVGEFGPPEVMRLESVPDLTPGENQVVLTVKAAGVNPVDTYIRGGGYARKPPLPYTPGSDAAGVVESVGKGVTLPEPGARVYTRGTISGAYAEQALCEVSQVHPLPDNVTFAQGAGVGIPYATAFRGLFQKAWAIPGEWVLVHGATGGVGLAAIQLCRAAGMKVIATGGTERGRSLALFHGADHVLDHTAPGYLDAVPALTEGHGIDVVLEMLANVNLDHDLKLLPSRGGRLIVIGSRGRIEIDPRDIMSREALVTGVLMFNATPKELEAIHAGINAGLEDGTLRPVVGEEMPLAEAPRAHKEIMAGGAHGKIVLIP